MFKTTDIADGWAHGAAAPSRSISSGRSGFTSGEEDDFDEVEDTLTDGQVCYDDFEAMSDEEAVGAYNSLPWIKAIVVNIDLPD